MKIAIVGGGICGLSTYLNLRKHVCKDSGHEDTLEITIFERHVLKHDTSSRWGDIPSSGGGYGQYSCIPRHYDAYYHISETSVGYMLTSGRVSTKRHGQSETS